MNAADPIYEILRKTKKKATIQKIAGWLLVIYSCRFVIFGLGILRDILDLIIILFFMGMTALGFWLIAKGRRKTKLIKIFPDYSARLTADPEGSIDRLAASRGIPVKKATKNIRDMLSLGFFPGSFLDVQRNCVVMPNAPQAQPQAAAAQTADAPYQAVQYTTVQCKGCGAVNRIVAGTTGQCEYCGSQISG